MAGYIGTTPVPQATQHRESFTATGGQTSFATAGYTPQFIDVYLNGVKLAPADFTATNGSDVVLASGATASDILEIVAYTPFEVANQTFTGDTSVTNLAVTGTFTSRGIDDNADAVAITIDSSENVGIGTTSPSANLHLSGQSQTIKLETTNDSSTFLNIRANSGTGGSFYVGQDSSAGSSFGRGAYAGVVWQSGAYPIVLATNNSERMRIDSSGNVGIGVVPESWYIGGSMRALQVGGNTGVMSLFGTRAIFSSNYYLKSGTGADTYINTDEATQYYQEAGTHVWKYAPSGTADTTISWSEAMRIDSSGNLLVGTTDSTVYNNSGSGTGINLQNFGNIGVARDGNDCMVLNRLNSDGDILVFHKDGAPVGSIGTASGYMYLGDGNGATGAGLHFVDTGIRPYDAKNNSASDAEINLGVSGARFKDLYLSGGVYLGGVGSANKLEDYEEGSWTPVINGGTTNPTSPVYGEQLGSYTKVGNIVTVNCIVKINSLSANGTGSVEIGGLPFSGKTQNSIYQPAAINLESLNTALTSDSIIGLIPSSSSTFYIYRNNAGTGGMVQITWGTYWIAGSRLRFNMTYFTN